MSLIKDVTTGGGNVIAVETGGNLEAIATAVAGTLTVDGSGVTQPVSDAGGSLTVDGTVAVSSVAGTVTVSGPLTDAQLRATAVPISASSLPLPTGAATSALQTTGNTSLSSIDGKLPALSNSRVPVLVAGLDATVTPRTLLIDTANRAWTMPSGFVAVGASAAAINPVYVGGADGSGNARAILTTTAGAVQTYPSRATLSASAPATASITTASAQVVALNASRTGLVITNTHATSWLYLGIGATAVVGSGIALAPNGGCWTMDAFTISTAAVNGIASAGTITVAVQEFA